MSIHTAIHEPGDGFRYHVVWGVIEQTGEPFVALPGLGKSAIMTPYPVEWSYVAMKLDVDERTARAVFQAINGVESL